MLCGSGTVREKAGWSETSCEFTANGKSGESEEGVNKR